MSTEDTLPQSETDLQASLQLSQTRVDTLHAPRIPGYDLLELLGEGRFGTVWKAHDYKLKIVVAVKIFKSAGGMDYSLFTSEVEKLRALTEDSRFIVALRDIGADHDPPYLVMDYVESSLEAKLRQGPMSVDAACDLFEELVRGIVQAHNRGILHCDLKPANVLLDRFGQPRIADFGQSRLCSQQQYALGTLFYMAPEQADLRGVPDARWDVYSLGAVMYRMLTGKPPYASEELRTLFDSGKSTAEVLELYRNRLSNSPPPKLHHGLPGVDRELARIIDRCLTSDPKNRYPNAQAVADHLRAWRQRRRQRPLRVLVLLLGLLPVLLLLLGAVAFDRQIRSMQQQATERLTQTTGDSQRAYAATAAGLVAKQFDLRWRSLETLAQNTDLQENLEEWSKLSETDRPESQESAQLREILHAYTNRENSVTQATACMLLDRNGTMAALAPNDQWKSYVNRSFAHRDYFYGANPGSPITEPYLSRAIQPKPKDGSQMSHHLVAFSVPVPPYPKTADEVIGVLCLVVPVTKFTEVPYTNLQTKVAQANLQDPDWIPQFTAIVDTRPVQRAEGEPDGDPGLVLQHAFYKLDEGSEPLEVQTAAGETATKYYERAPQRFVTGKTLDALCQLYGITAEVRQSGKTEVSLDTSDDIEAAHREQDRMNEELAQLYEHHDHELSEIYEDPFADLSPRFDTREWFVSGRPLFVGRPGGRSVGTGLVVLSAQRRDQALETATALATAMRRNVRIVFLLAAFMVLLVWSYAYIILVQRRRTWLTRRLFRAFAPKSLGWSDTAPSSGAARSTNLPTDFV